MTPAINLLKKQKIAHIVHEYVHNPASASYGLEAAEKLGIAPERLFKTLVVALDSKALSVAVPTVLPQLNMKQAGNA